MLNEMQIRKRKGDLLRAIENENEEISERLKEIAERKERIKDYQSGIKELNAVLSDERD